MDHLKGDFNIPDVDVENVTRLDRYSPPSDWMSFHDFARERGWTLGQDYKIGPFYNPDSDQSSQVEKELGPFLQAWLFFGLIFTVVQEEGQPILVYDDLLSDDKHYVTTKKLNPAMEKWQNWELQNPNGIKLRMIRAERVLDIARRVTRRNCSYDKSVQLAPGNPLYISDSLALSLMILGETLSAVKSQILEQTCSELRGWHRDDGEGWGQPQYVWSRMHKEQWCPRTTHLWRNQLRSHATLLLASWWAYRETDRFRGQTHTKGTDHHPKCDNNNCFVKPLDKAGQYRPAHAGDCIDEDCGQMQGPNMVVVRELLEEKPEAKIPLLQFREDPTNASVIELTVLPRTKETDYATISHVWSDGFGNETENKLYPCQLRFIWRQLRSLGFEHRPFWMDTLVIPLAPKHLENRNKSEYQKHLERRKLAISQIFTVFRESAFTIVLDGGLTNMPPGVEDKPAHAAMRILASSWMRRLWTLQEAFLSNKIHFSFRESQRPDKHLREFKDVSANLRKSSGASITTALLSMVNEHLRHHIIDHERGERRNHLMKRDKGLEGRPAAVLIANIWKAAKWRTTSNEYHETLALATLLNLDYQNTTIEKEGLEQAPLAKKQSVQDDARRTGKMDALMVRFWTQFNDRWPDSIPPGIIFLQGERINKCGFGWATRTWMSADPVDAPDPLGIINSTAGLDMTNRNGLKVSYPGFLLESKNKKLLLATDKQDKRFWFPTGPNFLDWYVAEPADDTTTPDYLQRLIDDPEPLAIILSRPKPDDAPAEIGLLVRIWKIENTDHSESRIDHNNLTTRSSGDEISRRGLDFRRKSHHRIFFSEIIRRVKVSRETQPNFHAVNRGRYFENYKAPDDAPHIPEIMVNPEMDDEICVAEELDNSQVWYVDSYFADRGQTGDSTGAQAGPSKDGQRSLLLRLFGGTGSSKSQQVPGPRRVGTIVEEPSRSFDEAHPAPKPTKRSVTWNWLSRT